jgi:hypothetical protein
MTETMMGFLPEDRQIFRPVADLGEALREAARGLGSAKHIERRWRLDPTTAENVKKGAASARTVVKAVRAEGDSAWDLWDALGELLIGESRQEHEERKLQSIIEATERARQSFEDRRRRRSLLEAGPPDVGEMVGR